MEILTSGARSLLHTAGLSYEFFWEHALLHRAYLQNVMVLPGRCSPFESRTGQQPALSYLRIFGCETLSYVEKTKRKKFGPKAERGIYLGTSPTHSIDTCKIWNLRTGQIMYRRNTAFNEKIFVLTLRDLTSWTMVFASPSLASPLPMATPPSHIYIPSTP
jgi:hypothetical protein